MKKIINNWNLFRAVRFFIGIAIVAGGIMNGEIIFAFAGILLSLIALANIGCCGAVGCHVPRSSQRDNKIAN